MNFVLKVVYMYLRLLFLCQEKNKNFPITDFSILTLYQTLSILNVSHITCANTRHCLELFLENVFSLVNSNVLHIILYLSCNSRNSYLNLPKVRMGIADPNTWLAKWGHNMKKKQKTMLQLPGCIYTYTVAISPKAGGISIKVRNIFTELLNTTDELENQSFS